MMFQVLPHEISIANKEDYTQLLAKMGDWAEEGTVDAPQELRAANTVPIHSNRNIIACIMHLNM
jgi:hypothetical protein